MKAAVLGVFVTGIFVIITWARNPDETPGFVSAFGLVVIGWIVALIGVLFKTGDDS